LGGNRSDDVSCTIHHHTTTLLHNITQQLNSQIILYDFTEDLPSELVDWDPRLISINTNGFANSHRYILQTLSLTHDVTFVQETRFRNPTLQDRMAYHWNRLTNHEGILCLEDPIYPTDASSPALGGLATLIHPNSPLRNARTIPQDSPILAGRYLQVRCDLGPAILVLHNMYAPVAPSERAAYFNALPRNFPPHYLHIASGDVNCILNRDLDSLRPSMAVMAGSTELTTWLHDLALVDIYRVQKPLTKTFTSPKLVNRLDYIFCSKALARLSHWKATHLPHIPHADHVACHRSAPRTSA
jgi:exonuclease III